MDQTPRWKSVVAADLQSLQESHLLRRRKLIRAIDATHVECDGRCLANFSSNNYLGLSHHPEIIAAVGQAGAREGFGSAAAPLISGYGPTHASAERAIAAWKGTESAIILPSGYQANVAAIQTAAAIGKLCGGVRFLVDKLAHASLIDAIRSTGQPMRVFPHNHMVKLKRLLEEAAAGELQVVVTESIFSMDGDAADLPAIAKLKQSHEFLLVLDEAHATGVYGPAGRGLAAEFVQADSSAAPARIITEGGTVQQSIPNISAIGFDRSSPSPLIDVSIFTLSKALGGVGGVVCGSAAFCDALINHGRAYLFSTAVPPAVAAAAETAIKILEREPHRQRRVRDLARRVREDLLRLSMEVPPGDSPIIPIIVGSEEAALQAAENLFQAGLLVMPVRPPTVPRGKSRLRVTLSSSHTDEEIAMLVNGIGQLPSSCFFTLR